MTFSPDHIRCIFGLFFFFFFRAQQKHKQNAVGKATESVNEEVLCDITCVTSQGKSLQ